MKTLPFSFRHNGNELHGIIDYPGTPGRHPAIIFVHGSGTSDVVAGNWYAELRELFSRAGMICCTWDKPGCGKSEGQFDINQTVQDSASEVVAVLREMRDDPEIDKKRIGLWGISRAGWICPLAINACPDIGFWISVSGPDDKENFRYLLETNLRIEGCSEAEITAFAGLWQRCFNLLRSGAPYAKFQKAVQIGKEAFPLIMQMFGQISDITEESYLQEQQKFLTGVYQVDEESGLMIYVPDFAKILTYIKCPVLAIFGEKDGHVDWRKTAVLYRNTIGSAPQSDLTIRTFPNGNHCIMECETGGVREMAGLWAKNKMCAGYHLAMLDWLQVRGFASLRPPRCK